MEGLENSNFLERGSNFKNNISSYFNTKKNKIDFKNATLDIVAEVIKYTNNITIIPEIYIKNSKILKDSNLIIKNIDNLFSKPAYFNIIKLKNSIMKNSVNWLIEKLKSLK